MIRLGSTQPRHPGSIIRQDFLKTRFLTLGQLAILLDMPLEDLEKFVDGKTDVTPDLAARLADSLQTEPEFWMRLQQEYDFHRRLMNSAAPTRSQLQFQRPPTAASKRKKKWLPFQQDSI